MPRNARLGRKHTSPHDPNASLSRDELEDRIQQAIASWKQNESPNLLSAAKKYGIAHKYSTLRRRAHGLTESYSNAQQKRRLLTDAQEAGLIQRFHSLDCPISRDTLRSFVSDICGTYPSNNWVTRFRVRHPEIKLCRPTRDNSQPVKTSNDLPGDQVVPFPDNPNFTVIADALAGPSWGLPACLENSDSSDTITTLTSSDWDFSDISSISSISETSMLEFMAEMTWHPTNRVKFPSAHGGSQGLPFFSFARDIEVPSPLPVRHATTSLASHPIPSEDKIARLLTERIENLAKLQELEWQRQTSEEHLVILKEEYEQFQRQWNAKHGTSMQEDRRVQVHSRIKARGAADVSQPGPSIYPAPLVISAPGFLIHPASEDVFHQYAIMSDAAQRTAAWVHKQANQAPSRSTSVAHSQDMFPSMLTQ